MADDTTRAGDQGQELGGLRVEVDGPRFRVRPAGFSTHWLPDTPSHRHLALVWLRLLVDGQGKPLFTLQAVAAMVGSANRQAASQHLEDLSPVRGGLSGLCPAST
ncbi:MAG TPA: hypothetical protein VLK82_02050 [Candidatus Tectomicrobia bacterium]|nr:hypothetical protein [Candidatus Tectomicrobia bacterium]